jgi:peptidoglycan/xylan/chitin deacetylase (PgdA/CDA1 family)
MLSLSTVSRGTRGLLSRIIEILTHFGITSKKFEDMLDRYSSVTRALGCIPTFPLTAVTLKRHPKPIRELCQRGIEFAVHGYIHTDYSALPLQEQAKQLRKAINTFGSHHIPYTGFRAPFLRTNDQTPQVLARLGFAYDSSHVLYWNVVDKTELPDRAWREYDRLLRFYRCRKAEEYLALPRLTDGFVEVPVSIPDDEAIVERFGITVPQRIAKIWRDILNMTYQTGELFVLQLHPERISLCESALADVLKEAKRLDPPVWVVTLREIAEWWKERASFKVKISTQGSGKYRVLADCSDRATLLLKKCNANAPVANWSLGYQEVKARDFILESPKSPVVGVGFDSSSSAVSFLSNEGFIVERSERRDDYGIYFSNLAQFDESDEKPLAQEIEQSGASLLRYWRWPDRAKSALCVTGDIDSMTLIDFGLRIFENWREKGRKKSSYARSEDSNGELRTPTTQG